MSDTGGSCMELGVEGHWVSNYLPYLSCIVWRLPGLSQDYHPNYTSTRHSIKVEKPNTQKLGNIRINIVSVL